ncbi:hypothetical protein CC86DRAFT_379830 [Ophiobolus disseminans]|uniref:Uncharacterized protein n=1 Tax=Ophiobolus disseminans TaxID=1469910 RepID=A0A6A7A8L8_9PLEO|nr:hypothetical protein CC86DRAFT_379830 [Ophiobolus disseminans]
MDTSGSNTHRNKADVLNVEERPLESVATDLAPKLTITVQQYTAWKNSGIKGYLSYLDWKEEQMDIDPDLDRQAGSKTKKPMSQFEEGIHEYLAEEAQKQLKASHSQLSDQLPLCPPTTQAPPLEVFVKDKSMDCWQLPTSSSSRNRSLGTCCWCLEPPRSGSGSPIPPPNIPQGNAGVTEEDEEDEDDEDEEEESKDDLYG